MENENNQGWFNGDFENGLRQGIGKYIWPNNAGEYNGSYREGERHTGPNGDDAIMVWQSGESKHEYVGKFEAGQCTMGRLDGN